MAVPHLRIPFRIDRTGTAEVVEQDSFEEIAQCVQTLVTTRLGERVEVPDYGIPDQVFLSEPAVQSASLATQIEQWEPRATALVESTPDSADELLRRLRILLGSP